MKVQGSGVRIKIASNIDYNIKIGQSLNDGLKDFVGKIKA